ncbi:hypothetical protein N474_08735 [Pseudoalteromonas luteoviolacea CPMOR-2]|uniref:Uncharacterized protein n=1 Tax=Pseudoalteromonas luteoviolacea DSM 6061 TaxID=1365250 RepID=A0A166XGV6_9GAMM|nr:hypothetical protein [Pseudoalteromonas luteoviolacea]KZN40302.1 hypothetical protein N475_12615 [Pseudoalteromonas luteoviolacea DSM 6061]KZN57276.1 hypothetical protein N474_08735 [Pseudoalteromonas luteoviolacea CPMOR-2]MBE0387919.1 hypothetical protein [Pseudoalteromonas luteoviolacea DSM 6061]
MKKVYALTAIAVSMFVSASALAAQGECALNLVKEDGNFLPGDYGHGNRVTYNVTIPYTDGFYPNPWTSTQPKPRLPFSNCITHYNVPANAKINSISVDYTFQEAVLVADYEILMGFMGPTNKFDSTLKRGGGNRRGSGIPLRNTDTTAVVNGQFLKDIELELRARVNNPAVNNDCPQYISRDTCRTRNTRLSNFTVKIQWRN